AEKIERFRLVGKTFGGALKDGEGFVVLHEQHISPAEPDVIDELRRVCGERALVKLRRAFVAPMFAQRLAKHEIGRGEVRTLSERALPVVRRLFVVVTRRRDETERVKHVWIVGRET